MPESLYLLETRAQREYTCPGCGNLIPRGAEHFRHDPFPAARVHRGIRTSHWCKTCVLATNAQKDWITGRIRIPITLVRRRPATSEDAEQGLLWKPAQAVVVGIGTVLTNQLIADPTLLHALSPDQFEEFVCERLFAMGLEPKRIGKVNRKDGGIDVVFWPRGHCPFPFLGAAQIKHHRDRRYKEGPASVRDFAGTIAGHSFNAGLLVTNTTFSPDAQWFAREKAKLVRLRDFDDLRRWLVSNFGHDSEWREIPSSIEVCPGTIVEIR